MNRNKRLKRASHTWLQIPVIELRQKREHFKRTVCFNDKLITTFWPIRPENSATVLSLLHYFALEVLRYRIRTMFSPFSFYIFYPVYHLFDIFIINTRHAMANQLPLESKHQFSFKMESSMQKNPCKLDLNWSDSDLITYFMSKDLNKITAQTTDHSLANSHTRPDFDLLK